MFNQGTSKPEASHSENDSENGDMAWACCEELVELDDVQLATVVGGIQSEGWAGIWRYESQRWNLLLLRSQLRSQL
jgi:hypothetical protein